jgi:hypothetical protein
MGLLRLPVIPAGSQWHSILSVIARSEATRQSHGFMIYMMRLLRQNVKRRLAMTV